MASQIDQMRAKFNGMNNTQKKDFIDKLKVKLQGSSNAEYKKFLNECVQKYNASTRGVSTSTGNTGTKSISSAYSKSESIRVAESSSECSYCGNKLAASDERCPYCLMLSWQSKRQSKRGSDDPALIFVGNLALAIIGFLFFPFAIVAIILSLKAKKRGEKNTKVTFILGCIGVGVGFISMAVRFLM